MILSDIYAKLPHAGDMCLLEQLLDWDSESILCETSTHRKPDNPLRCGSGLPAVHGAEYAAQAAAVHGVLCERLGDDATLLLGAVNDLELMVSHLDKLTAPLRVAARLELRAGINAIYHFEVTAQRQCCIRGRITLMHAIPVNR